MEDINWKFLIIIHKKNKLLKWNRAWDFLILENAFLSEGITESQCCMIKPQASVGRLGGSVGWPSNFSSGHDLVVCEFEPHIKLCADCSKPEAPSNSMSLSLSAPPPQLLCLSASLCLSLKNKHWNKNKDYSLRNNGKHKPEITWSLSPVLLGFGHQNPLCPPLLWHTSHENRNWEWLTIEFLRIWRILQGLQSKGEAFRLWRYSTHKGSLLALTVDVMDHHWSRTKNPSRM